jgi:hypothetical protein
VWKSPVIGVSVEEVASEHNISEVYQLFQKKRAEAKPHTKKKRITINQKQRKKNRNA